MTDADIDLSIPALARLCKGNPANLPVFVLHDDDTWPRYDLVMPDDRGRVHMRRSMFNRVVAGQVPVRPGLWVRATAQEFHIDLQPHHLQGDGTQAGRAYDAAAHITKMDSAGRTPGMGGDYGQAGLWDSRGDAAARDARRIAALGTGRSIRSSVEP